jgi:hypothetical protein
MQPKGEEPPRIVNGGEVGEGPRGPSNDIRMPHLKKVIPEKFVNRVGMWNKSGRQKNNYLDYFL